MSEIQIQPASPEVISSGEPLTEGRLGELLSAIGNHEAKAIVLGGMVKGVPYGVSALHRLFIDPQGDHLAYRGAVNNQMDYCSISFAGVGCVAKLLHTPTTQYELTDFGENEGKALAGHLLDFSLSRPEITLRSFFGMTKKTGTREQRPPADRLDILRILLDFEDVQIGDIEELTGLPQNTVTHNLQWLDKNKVINFNSAHGRDLASKVIFDFPEKLEFEPTPGMPQVVYKIVKDLIDAGHKTASFATIVQQAEVLHPQQYLAPKDRGYVSRILGDMIEGGHLTKGKLGGRRKSEIQLTSEMREAIEQIINIADGMLSGDPIFLKEGKEKLEAILAIPDKVRPLIKKAFQASPEANGVPAEERFQRVTAFLTKHELSTSSQIALALEENGITRSSAKDTLQKMRNLGLLESILLDGENVWGLVQEPPESTDK